jgi:rifampicin phosphotransferase
VTGGPGGTAGPPPLLRLTDARATDAALVGAKAANLALAAAGGLPVLPGFVLTTTSGSTVEDLGAAVEAGLAEVAEELLGEQGRRVVVRSSSTVEDIGASSMAGQFTSVLGVADLPALLDAVRSVLASAERPHDPSLRRRPMGVLVQPELDAAVGGVLFGVEPVSGDPHRLVVEAVEGGPVAVVDGRVVAAHLTLSPAGLLVAADPPGAQRLLDPWKRRRLTRLAKRAARIFGGPQDIEWAFDRSGRLWLLQSRPVTAVGEGPGEGPLLGPGPVAETFPDPLRPLEEELWVGPLARGLAGAIAITGAVSAHRIERSPVVTTVGGRVAADLGLLGGGTRRGTLQSPWRAARRLATAWRVGRLRAALPGLADDLLTRVDTELGRVPPLADLPPGALVAILRRSHDELVAVHGLEALAGMLEPTSTAPSLASLALGAAAAGQQEGLGSAEIVTAAPVTLALVPPRIGGPPELPDVPSTSIGSPPLASLGPREALRLRSRWIQELTAQVALELGRRLAADRRIDDPALVRELSLDELARAADGGPLPDDLRSRAARRAGPPLPTSFRLGRDDTPVATALATHAGRPAGGGRKAGRVAAGSRACPGEVLVVDVLDPRLAGELPALAGLVAESGSSLSHLAILARELHVPTVVGVPGARQRFPAGTLVLVDGGTGEVTTLDDTDRTEEGGRS